MKHCLYLLLLSCLPFVGYGQIIETVAGNGQYDNLGDGGQAVNAGTNYPAGLVFDKYNTLYISLGISGNKIRKVTPAGIITTVAGTGFSGYTGDGGLAVNATFKNPSGMALDSLGNIFVADGENHAIRKIDIATNIISTVSGSGVGGYSGDGGIASMATLYYPSDVCFDKFGNLYIADGGNHRVRKVNTSGIISTFAGTGAAGHDGDGGLAFNAKLTPGGLCIDDTGNVYIADGIFIRKVDLNGIIHTIAGNGTGGSSGDGGLAINAEVTAVRVAFDKRSKILYITGNVDNKVRAISNTGIIYTVAGTGAIGFSGDGGPAELAELHSTFGVTTDSCGNVYVADGNNRRVRKISYPGCNQVHVSGTILPISFTLHPNPATSQLTITGSTTLKEISITNTIGQVELRQSYHAQKVILIIDHLQPGIYFVSVTDVGGNKKIEKIIKQ